MEFGYHFHETHEHIQTHHADTHLVFYIAYELYREGFIVGKMF